MARETIVGWLNLINALGIGLIAMLLTVIGMIYTGVPVPEPLVPAIGVIVGGGYLLEAEWGISGRIRSTR
ncbi:hypothetical protein [Halocatena salina]|uniref:Uncharacterized protein n=1 Tax=Halocatena salina TaxID=2934340 RepID=A0A8T9ZYG0_9EURY|nr:hypothetical protein [Halocatena salina]UPM41705.1 hypothetical protein MW046_06810 [Halocatena salina]